MEHVAGGGTSRTLSLAEYWKMKPGVARGRRWRDAVRKTCEGKNLCWVLRGVKHGAAREGAGGILHNNGWELRKYLGN